MERDRPHADAFGLRFFAEDRPLWWIDETLFESEPVEVPEIGRVVLRADPFPGEALSFDGARLGYHTGFEPELSRPFFAISLLVRPIPAVPLTCRLALAPHLRRLEATFRPVVPSQRQRGNPAGAWFPAG